MTAWRCVPVRLRWSGVGSDTSHQAWFRVGDHQIKTDRYGRDFDFGHICGSYDSAEQGGWELFLSTHDCPPDAASASPGPLLAPGVTFQNSNHVWERLGPWKYPEGIIDHGDGDDATAACSVTDTEWHHVAWQYEHSTDTHELWLDGRLIWRLGCVDGVQLTNDRVGHGAQFSVSTRLAGYTLPSSHQAHCTCHVCHVRSSNLASYLLDLK